MYRGKIHSIEAREHGTHYQWMVKRPQLPAADRVQARSCFSTSLKTFCSILPKIF